MLPNDRISTRSKSNVLMLSLFLNAFKVGIRCSYLWLRPFFNYFNMRNDGLIDKSACKEIIIGTN